MSPQTHVLKPYPQGGGVRRRAGLEGGASEWGQSLTKAPESCLGLLPHEDKIVLSGHQLF